ncbi:hypothetical protein C8Q75DRAFT_710843 [Abortiporus biennis]|nr:hypothetical protein C8Q75DRAFT_710843 [Abortiporus biennis]
MSEAADSRPSTPDSPSSLRDATATIDDLTLALADFSRAHSPEPPNITICCCGKDDCTTSIAWSAYKAKLESRLVLSAEVGQALLERHEAYVRRHEGRTTGQHIPDDENGRVETRVADLLRENAVLEKRLTQALVNNEVAESSHQAVLQELKDAKATISKLSAQNARAVGIDVRLNSTMQEKDDIQQERDSAIQRARMAELRIAAFKEKCAKLQAQVNRLREDLDMHRTHRHEWSEEILSDARQRLQQLQQLQLGRNLTLDDGEVTKVLESLVADNEALKHDNAELQNMLTETREDIRALQEEVDERRADKPVFSRHQQSSSITSSHVHDPSSPLSPTFHVGTAPSTSVFHSAFSRNASKAGPSTDRRAVSMERGRRPFEPLTPESHRPLSPESFITRDPKFSSFSQPHSRYAPSQLSLEVDEERGDSGPLTPERPRGMKSLLLLTRSRGVQTDPIGIGTPVTSSTLAPSPVPRAFGDQKSISSPHDGVSESSSITGQDSQTTIIGILLERISHLMNRLSQADALTLTNRLKRQHLLGADVGHLSRSTVNNIIQEVSTLRTQFRAFLEDEKVITTCTRKDLRGLFKLFKEMFSEMGELRVTLNDVILDPTVAGRVSDLAMNPHKARAAELADSSGGSSNSSGWMAPITKLLGIPGISASDQDPAIRALSPPARPANRGRARASLPPPRVVPKREAALSASAMTVNVEFSGAGVGRAVTSTFSAHPDSSGPHGLLSTITSPNPSSTAQSPRLQSAASSNSRSVMDIFAGAPRNVTDSQDPWIVVPKAQGGSGSGLTPSTARRFENLSSGSATIGRRTSMRALGVGAPSANTKLSRIVDAVIDRDPVQTHPHSQPSTSQDATNADEADEARDVLPDTLLERTLRPRGLSDSSIHTMFMSHGENHDELPAGSSQGIEQEPKRPDRTSVLQALSRKVSSFRFASAAFANSPIVAVATSVAASAISRPQTPANPSANPESTTTAAAASIQNALSPSRKPPSPPRPIPQRAGTSPRDSEGDSTGAGSLFTGLSQWASAAIDPTNPNTEPVSFGSTGAPYHYVGNSPTDDRFLGREWARERRDL